MKLLHVVDSMDPVKGGVSHAVQTIATEVTKAGFFNEVLTLDPPGNIESTSMYRINNIGPSKGPWSYSSALIPWLLKNLKRFDIVIVHGLWLYSGYAVRQAISKYKSKNKVTTANLKLPKLFIMPHGMLDPYFQHAEKRKIKAIRNWVYWKMIESNLVNGSDGILFTCKQECLLARKPFRPYRPKRELVVGLGISAPPAFSFSMIDTFNNLCPNVVFGKYILYLGRIDVKKGVDLLLQAYRNIISTYGINKCPQLILAGPGMDTEYGTMLEMFVNANPDLKANTHIAGMLSGEKKWAAIYGCEAFILPSHQENFGISVIEALACGKPVLISKQVNINNELAQAQAAIIGDDTLNGIYEMLESWMATPEAARRQMSLNARRCYEKQFAIQRATNNLIEAIST